MKAKYIYKITYPNGKIYVGMDVTGDLLYVGSPSARAEIAADNGIDPAQFPHHPLRRQTNVTGGPKQYLLELAHLDITLQKDILWESDTAPVEVVRSWEKLMIRRLRANNPAVGYNRTPKYLATP